MSQFEYVSVATALVYSFAIARLLAGLPHTARRGGVAAVALVWNLNLILWALTAWWVFWRFNHLTWTALSFVWAVATPSLILLGAAILLTDQPSQVTSWQQQYSDVRRRFFGMMLVMAAHTFLTPWIVGAYPWFSLAPAHPAAVLTALVAIISMFSASNRVNLALAILMLLSTSFGLFTVPGTNELVP